MRRTVQFWQVADGKGDMLSLSFPGSDLVQKLQAARTAGISRYYTASDGYRMLGVGVETSPTAHVALYRSRHVNLPGKDVDGEVLDLGLSQGEGLAEGTHFLFFPNNIVGVLYNFEGPSTRRMAAYLFHKFDLDISFVPVYRKDIAELLAQLDKVTKLEMSIPANQVALLTGPQGSADGFAAALAQTAELLQEGNVRLEISVGQGAPPERSEKLKTLARRFARRNDLDRFRVAKVYGRLENEAESSPIDLKAEQLVTKKDVAPESPTSTRLSQASASAAIRQAKQEYSAHIDTVSLAMPSLTSSLPIGDINPAESRPEGD